MAARSRSAFSAPSNPCSRAIAASSSSSEIRTIRLSSASTCGCYTDPARIRLCAALFVNLFELDDPFGLDTTFPRRLPRDGRLPVITEKDLDTIDERMRETETAVLRTMPPSGGRRNKLKNTLDRTRQEISKLRRIIDDPGASEGSIYEAIKNLQIFEKTFKEQAADLEKFVKKRASPVVARYLDQRTRAVYR